MPFHTLWLYHRRDGAWTLHWMPGCPLGLAGHRDRLLELDRDWQHERGWTADARWEEVARAVARSFDATVCGHCFPGPVLLALGLTHDDRRRPGEPLPAA
jgi:hypothetical protein